MLCLFRTKTMKRNDYLFRFTQLFALFPSIKNIVKVVVYLDNEVTIEMKLVIHQLDQDVHQLEDTQ